MKESGGQVYWCSKSLVQSGEIFDMAFIVHNIFLSDQSYSILFAFFAY